MATRDLLQSMIAGRGAPAYDDPHRHRGGRMRDTRRNILQLAVATLAAAFLEASAGVPALGECLEGGDFIGNAARGRDNGISRATFMDQMSADFMVIRAFPPPLRWFAKDADDEEFLRAAAAEVFDRPLEAEAHRASFIRACLARHQA
jgi:hypothetical protein